MIQEEQIMEEAIARLKLKTGIHTDWKYEPKEVDGEVKMLIRDHTFHAFVEVKREVRQYQIKDLIQKANLYHPFMVIAEHIFPAIKERLREENIAYLDIAGNAFICGDGVLLWIDGQKEKRKAKPVTNRAFTKTGLRVVFQLLWEPEAINMPYRMLAERAGVGLGNIQNVLDGLKGAGFVLQLDKQRRVLHNKKALLRRWIDGYRETLKPALHIGNYRFWNKNMLEDWKILTFPERVNAAWSGEPAGELITGYLNPQELTLYTNNKTALVPKWRLIPEETGVLHIYEQFWLQPGIEPGGNAPALLVYADLILTDDPRCIETAQMIYDKFLKDEFEGN